MTRVDLYVIAIVSVVLGAVALVYDYGYSLGYDHGAEEGYRACASAEVS